MTKTGYYQGNNSSDVDKLSLSFIVSPNKLPDNTNPVLRGK